jgi:hypothetical protein
MVTTASQKVVHCEESLLSCHHCFRLVGIAFQLSFMQCNKPFTPESIFFDVQERRLAEAISTSLTPAFQFRGFPFSIFAVSSVSSSSPSGYTSPSQQ